MVGPEGGSSEAEIAELEAAGVHRFALGRTTLRIETAAAATLAVLALGD